MKHTYTSFSEMAEGFTDGDSWTHEMSDHTSDECCAWQHGVEEFANWLDECGVKIIENPEIYDKLWDSLRTHKPDKFSHHPKK